MNRKSTAEDATSGTTEIAGPGGFSMTGGDLTPPQNAGDKLDNANDERRGEQRMEHRQMAGAVEQQNYASNPSATDPEGMPDAIQGRAVKSDDDADSD